jgi:hypothetical protein
MNLILLVVLIMLIVGALPTWRIPLARLRAVRDRWPGPRRPGGDAVDGAPPRARGAVRVAALVVVATLAAVGTARAQGAGRLTLDEENDKFGSLDDRHYTQGLRLTYLTPSITGGVPGVPFDCLADHLFVLARVDPTERDRKIAWTILGQSLFTPQNTRTTTQDPHDRPYAAWLYTGASLLQESSPGRPDRRMLENLELLVGVVGPAALGREAQNDVHQFLGVPGARGWRHQLRNEPGMMLSYERKWDFALPLFADLAVDVIPEAGVTLGNVMTYGQLGGIARCGRYLGVDYGPAHIRPGVAGTGWFNAQAIPARSVGWYLFVGTQGRVVGHNVFLDGNTSGGGPSVDKRPVVADFVGGASLYWGEILKLDFTVTQRTREFYGQGNEDRFGMVTLSFPL